MFQMFNGVRLDASDADTVYFSENLAFSEAPVVAHNISAKDTTKVSTIASMSAPIKISNTLTCGGLGATHLKNTPMEISINRMIVKSPSQATLTVSGTVIAINRLDIQTPTTINIGLNSSYLKPSVLGISEIDNHPSQLTKPGTADRGYQVLISVADKCTFQTTSCGIFNSKFSVGLGREAKFTECGITLTGKMAIVFNERSNYLVGGRYVEHICSTYLPPTR